MPFGLENRDIKLIKDIFRLHTKVKEVLIFGSRAMGTEHPGSDIDLAVKGIAITARDILKIKSQLGELPLAYTYDVVNYHTIKTLEFIEHIDRHGILFYKQVAQPSDWQTRKLGEIVKRITSGGTPSTRNHNYYGGNIPWLKTQEVNFNRIYKTDTKITEEGLKNSSAKWIDNNSIVVAMYGATAGRVAINKIPLTTNQACCNITVNGDKASYEFIYYNLLNRYEELVKMSTGAAQQNLNSGMLRNLEINLPDLTTQTQIASILSSLDDKIALNQQMNQTLEATAQTVFKEWFVNFNFPGFDGELVDVVNADRSVSRLPKGWTYTNVETIALELEVGNRPKGGVKEFTDGIPSIGAESITRIGEYDFSKTKYIPIEFYDSMKKGKSKHLDLLVYKDGGKPGNYIPHISMFGFGFPFEEYAINEHVYRIQCKDGRMQGFLYFWMNTDNCIKEMKEKGTGVAIPGLNSTALKSVTVIQPDNDTLNAFFEISNMAIERILRNSGEIRILSQLRDNLLPKLMTGKIEIRP